MELSLNEEWGLKQFLFLCTSKASNNIASILDCNAFVLYSCLNACMVLKVISPCLSNCRHFLSKGSDNGYWSSAMPAFPIQDQGCQEVVGCSSTKLHINLRAGNAGCHFFRRDVFWWQTLAPVPLLCCGPVGRLPQLHVLQICSRRQIM